LYTQLGLSTCRVNKLWLLLHVCGHYSSLTGFSNLSADKVRRDLVAAFPTFPHVVRILMLAVKSIHRFLDRNGCHRSNRGEDVSRNR